MTPQELKSSILQLAIQGKLVEQRPEEGTGEELYRQIQKEKQELIKAGTIKKEKPLPAISEDDIPFEIPESWKWIRLCEISKVITKGTTPRGGNVSYLQNGIGFLRAENVAGLDRLDKTGMKFIDEKTHTGFLVRSILEADDILITIAGTLGRTGLVRSQDLPLNANQAVALIRLVDSSKVNLKYLVYSLNAASTQKALTAQKKVTAIPNLTLEIISYCAIPIPPLAEQERIATRVEEILPMIDRYEKAWSRLEDFNKRFPVDMQKSILQMAIQGKLVEQRPEEGTGEELFQQIQAEKQELIKEGKIKKEKPLPEISEDEIPFDIPDTWTWKRLGNISWYFDAGKSPNCLKTAVTGDEWGVITTTAVQLGYFDEVQNKILPKDFKVNTDIQVRPGDILITRAGPTNRTGIACLVKDIRYNLILSDKIIRINMTNSNIFKDYIIMVLNSHQIRNMIVGLMSGMDRQQVNVSQDKYKTLLIPIPPIAEQKRIVAKLEEILPLCKRIQVAKMI